MPVAVVYPRISFGLITNGVLGLLCCAMCGVVQVSLLRGRHRPCLRLPLQFRLWRLTSVGPCRFLRVLLFSCIFGRVWVNLPTSLRQECETVASHPLLLRQASQAAGGDPQSLARVTGDLKCASPVKGDTATAVTNVVHNGCAAQGAVYLQPHPLGPDRSKADDCANNLPQTPQPPDVYDDKQTRHDNH